jgi:hypothetical protein
LSASFAESVGQLFSDRLMDGLRQGRGRKVDAAIYNGIGDRRDRKLVEVLKNSLM